MTPPATMAAVQEAQFRILVESIKDYAIFMLDAQGRVLTWTAGAQMIKGYSAEEIIGRNMSQFYTPEDRARRHPDELLAAAIGRGRVEDEGWRLRKDGTRFWADVVITAVRDDAGALTGFAKVTRDLTERRNAERERLRREEELRRSEERFRLLVDAVDDYAILMLDLSGNVTTWNSGAERLFGFAPDAIIGTHFSRLRIEDEVRAGRCEEVLEIATRAGRLEQEGWRRRPDGSLFWASMVLTPVRNSAADLVGFAEVTRDLTERVRFETEREARAHAEEAVRLKDDFLAIAAHELRTPLTALQIEHQGLQNGMATAEPRLQRKLARAVRTAGRMAALVESLMEVGRIVAGKLTLKMERFELVQAVAQVVDIMRSTATNAGCELSLRTTALAIPGVWDRLRVEQVVMNILANAFKYAAGTPVVVSLRQEGDEAVIEIADQGPGIADKDLERIFGRFERAAPKRYYGGLGLGLYVSHEIVAAQKGMISARNIEGGGAAFTIRLPVDAARARAADGHCDSSAGAA